MTSAHNPAQEHWWRIPRAAWIVALLAAALHMLPHVHAELTAPADWQPTGILTMSPDFMQYRVWMRQSLEEGPIVSNRFTTERNQAYLPVPFYYAIGRVAQATGVTPEWVFEWIGAVLAFFLALLLFACARYFLRNPSATWTAYGAMLLGGGVGGYILYLRQSPWAWHVRPIQMLLIEPFNQYTELVDNLRGDYIFSTLFDTHFLLIWLICITAVMLFYATLKAFSPLRLALTAALFAAATVIHVYEGVTLILIVASIALLCWLKGLHRREAVISAAVCTASVMAVFLWIAVLVRAGGLPLPPWRGVPLHPSILFLAFPVAWVLVVWGLARYWQGAALEECFLLGWLLGCTALSLSAPFYPWPNRGVLSMQVPLTLIAAAIWFSRHATLSRRAAIAAVLLMGSTPAFRAIDRWENSGFDPASPHKFLGPAHRQILQALRPATPSDVLIAGAKDRLWLAPNYRGRHYAGHFFLTVDYDRKQSLVDDFYRAAPDAQTSFLRQHHVRFLYVNRKQNPARFRSIVGLVPVAETAVGTLFEYLPTRARSGA